jgi:hypothetical protein
MNLSLSLSLSLLFFFVRAKFLVSLCSRLFFFFKKIPHSPLRVLRVQKKTLITRLFPFLLSFSSSRNAPVTIKSTHAHGKTSFLNDDDDDDITLTDDDDDDVITCENAPPPP